MNWLRTQLFLLEQHIRWNKWANARIKEAKKQANKDFDKCLGMNCDKCRCGASIDCE
jgi:hypothetical protein